MKGIGLIIVIALVLLGAFMLIKPSTSPTATTTKGCTVTDSATTTIAKATKATIETDKGTIELELYPDSAPKTVENFAKKAAENYFDCLRFHRVEDWVVQGGDPLSKNEAQQSLWGTGGGEIETELSDRSFVEGALGVARGGDIKVSNDSQFFIVKNDSQFLDKQYTIFGKVTSGMDVVKSIAVGDFIRSVTVQ